MSGRFFNPRAQHFDSTPEVYSGGKLYFYEAGTSTPLDTYSDNALSVANANPVVLNSAGRPATDIFLQDSAYKVVLKDANDNTIWTVDPYRARDSALIVKTTSVNGSPSGSLAGTAGSSGVLPDFAWDFTNSILYVCTTTGSASTAAWTAINASAATASFFAPQGRLTPTSATPVITSDAASGTAVYYTPYVGNLVPIYNGSTMIPTEFSELTLTLASQHAADTIYDVFVFSNSGVLTLVTGPAWSVSTAGSGARGTGASTTELSRVKGLWTNAVQITGRNGTDTYTIGANLATYLGSLDIDSVAGQVTCRTAYGESRKFGVWNAYHQVPIILKAGNTTANWTYTTATFRAANGSATSSLRTFAGLPTQTETVLVSRFHNSSTDVGPSVNGVGWNSTSATSGFVSSALSFASNAKATLYAKYDVPPGIGANVVTALEFSTAAGTTTWYGGEDNLLLTGRFMG